MEVGSVRMQCGWALRCGRCKSRCMSTALDCREEETSSHITYIKDIQNSWKMYFEVLVYSFSAIMVVLWSCFARS